MTGVRLLRDEVRRGAAQAAHRRSGHTGAARQDQWYAARQTLRTGLVRLGRVPDLPDAHRRIGLAGPGAVRQVSRDGAALRPAVQFSVAHTAEQVVVALRRAEPADGAAPAGPGVDAETEWATAERNLHRFGTPAELDALRRACGPVVRPLHLWCVKEALAKASGLGFVRIPPRRYRLHAAGDTAPHRLTVEIAGADPPDGGPRRALVRTGTRTTAGRTPTAWAVAEPPTR
ncbi:4'-phosphopantetheinyl transferase superfamily protein [Kitasatospora sp. NPDC101157]|uniref:4'-phosphopantetheinyl transferase superfamily protein n=1 Tax=Kitasatospora sp. NPDC101157 TaxID=3364098 RepID=UPI003804A091